MTDKTNTEKIELALEKFRKLSKTEICNKTGIHPYLINTYLADMIKRKIIKQIKNKSGKYVWYELKKNS